MRSDRIVKNWTYYILSFTVTPRTLQPWAWQSRSDVACWFWTCWFSRGCTIKGTKHGWKWRAFSSNKCWINSADHEVSLSSNNRLRRTLISLEAVKLSSMSRTRCCEGTVSFDSFPLSIRFSLTANSHSQNRLQK